MNDKYYQLIPERILETFPAIEAWMKAEIKGYHPDHLKEVISIVAKHVKKDDEYTPLKSRYVRNLVPDGDVYLKALVTHKILDRTGPYVPGETSYKYTFATPYKSRVKRIELINPKLKARIRRVYAELMRQAHKTTWGCSEQLKDLNRLSMAPEWENLLTKDLTASQHNYYTASAQKVINGEIRYSVDNTSRRLHSNVTNMPKELRQHLRVNGERLVEVDIANSQPYLSTIILTEPSKIAHLAVDPAFKYVLTHLKVHDNKHDVALYIRLVTTGALYEFLQAEFEIFGIPHTRKETKTQVLRIMFAPNRSPSDLKNKVAREVFKGVFPTVFRIFNRVRGTKRGDKFASYSRFAILLQALESFLMLGRVLKCVYKELPGVVAITVHDGAMVGVTTNHVAGVVHIMEREFGKYVGEKPMIRVDGLHKSIEVQKAAEVYN